MTYSERKKKCEKCEWHGEWDSTDFAKPLCLGIKDKVAVDVRYDVPLPCEEKRDESGKPACKIK